MMRHRPRMIVHKWQPAGSRHSTHNTLKRQAAVAAGSRGTAFHCLLFYTEHPTTSRYAHPTNWHHICFLCCPLHRPGGTSSRQHTKQHEAAAARLQAHTPSRTYNSKQKHSHLSLPLQHTNTPWHHPTDKGATAPLNNQHKPMLTHSHSINSKGGRRLALVPVSPPAEVAGPLCELQVCSCWDQQRHHNAEQPATTTRWAGCHQSSSSSSTAVLQPPHHHNSANVDPSPISPLPSTISTNRHQVAASLGTYVQARQQQQKPQVDGSIMPCWLLM